MAQKSDIDWTDATWDPVTGCTKVGHGCDNCHAERFAERWRGIAGHLRIHVHDPREVFDPAGYAAVDGVAICARAGRSDKPLYLDHMTHFARNTDIGGKMRTRFGFGEVHHPPGDRRHPVPTPA